MTSPRILAVASATAVLASAGVALLGGDRGGVCGATHTGRAPVTIPGTAVKKDERLPSGARVVSRGVTLKGDQAVRFRSARPPASAYAGSAPGAPTMSTLTSSPDPTLATAR